MGRVLAQAGEIFGVAPPDGRGLHRRGPRHRTGLPAQHPVDQQPRADLVLQAAHRALAPGGRLLLSEPNWKHRFEGRQAASEYGVTDLGYTPHKLKRLLRAAGFTHIRRFHNNRKRLYSNALPDIAAHLAEPLAYRALAPFWTQIWLRAEAS